MLVKYLERLRLQLRGLPEVVVCAPSSPAVNEEPLERRSRRQLIRHLRYCIAARQEVVSRSAAVHLSLDEFEDLHAEATRIVLVGEGVELEQPVVDPGNWLAVTALVTGFLIVDILDDVLLLVLAVIPPGIWRYRLLAALRLVGGDF